MFDNIKKIGLKSLMPKLLPLMREQLKNVPKDSLILLSSEGTTVINGISLIELKKVLLFCENKGLIEPVKVENISTEKIQEVSENLEF